MALVRVGTRHNGALDAAAAFYAGQLPMVRVTIAELAEDIALVFEPASHEHRAWRLAVVQQLAREHAPIRVNGIETDDEEALAAALAYVQNAPGLTGHLLRLDRNGAGALLSKST